MNLVQRVKDILISPRTTWPQIEQEATDAKSLYTEYLVFVAAIPAIASFIGMSLFGVGVFGVRVRTPIVSGLVQMVVGYLLSLGMVFVLALVVNALAPSFGARKSPIGALKLVGYGATAGFVGGIFMLLPALAVLGLLAAIYSIYLVYTGLPVLMKCPPERATAYTVTVMLCGLVAGIVLAALSAAFTPSAGPLDAMRSGAGGVAISTPGGEIRIDTARLEQMAQQMEAAGKRMEAAQQAGDPAAAGKAVNEVLAALGGGGTPIAAQELKALLPDALLGLPRTAYDVRGGEAMGIAGSGAKASYGGGDRRVELTITDLGGIGAFAAMAGFAQASGESETDSRVEKTFRQGARTVHEAYRKDGSHAELTVFLGNGVMVELSGERLDIGALRRALDEAGVDRIESIRRKS